MEFSCMRCGYKSKHKQCVINHLSRKTKCEPTVEDIDPTELIAKLQHKEYNAKTYDCKYCSTRFNTCSSRARHYKVCKKKPVDRIEVLIKRIEKLEEDLQNKNNITTTHKNTNNSII